MSHERNRIASRSSMSPAVISTTPFLPLTFSDVIFRRPCSPAPAILSLHRPSFIASLFPIAAVNFVSKTKCFGETSAENHHRDSEIAEIGFEHSGNDLPRRITSSPGSDLLSLGIPEPVYQVVEVKSDGMISNKSINRRQLLKSSGLRPRDIRSVDPSLRLTNSMPSLLVREHAILLNLGSLRAIVMQEYVLIFNYNRRGGKAFLDTLLPRLSPENSNGGPSMPFVLEVVEAALLSRIQRLEQRMMELEPRVQSQLEVLPNRLTGDMLEQLRISKQTLVELTSRAAALRQMLLDLLEDTQDIRQITLNRINNSVKSDPSEKEIAEKEEEEIEMLLENYLQRCESLHGQAERLLDSAKEMEDSIRVSLSSRRLEVGKVELLLQVGAFFVAIGALVSAVFGMNLISYLEQHPSAFWFTTAGIMIGILVGFFLMYSYLKKRKIL